MNKKWAKRVELVQRATKKRKLKKELDKEFSLSKIDKLFGLEYKDRKRGRE
jgi:hypothetical protein